ncbi:hypothetical protein [Flagellimonas sp.]|uniref:hypothetical protein n=1 Tax=Flagellimonas sp. TaxID=2058762 RepID=UPI003BACAFCB
MDKYDIKKELEKLVVELKNSKDETTLWDNRINEALTELRKHTMHASGNVCPRCNGSGTV